MDTEKLLAELRAQKPSPARQTHKILEEIETQILYSKDRISLYNDDGWSREHVLDHCAWLSLRVREIRLDIEELILAHGEELEERDRTINLLEKTISHLTKHGAPQ